MKIDHIGYAVKRFDRAKNAFEEIGFAFGEVFDDYDRNIRISFGDKDGYRIELVSPLDKSKESPVDQYISKTVGTPYHICYESENYDSEISRLTDAGFKVVVESAPAIAFEGRRVVFMMNLGFGLMEIVEA